MRNLPRKIRQMLRLEVIENSHEVTPPINKFHHCNVIHEAYIQVNKKNEDWQVNF
jgi:hypothetical protein